MQLPETATNRRDWFDVKMGHRFAFGVADGFLGRQKFPECSSHADHTRSDKLYAAKTFSRFLAIETF